MKKILYVCIGLLLGIALGIGITLLIISNQDSSNDINTNSTIENKSVQNISSNLLEQSPTSSSSNYVTSEETPIEVTSDKLENVKLEIDDSTLSSSGAKLIITDMNKPDLGWGESYSIQKKEENNWVNLQPSEDVFFSLIHYNLDSNNQVIQQLNWVDYYGELENGTYRIVKSVGSNNIDVYSNEFTIK